MMADKRGDGVPVLHRSPYTPYDYQATVDRASNWEANLATARNFNDPNRWNGVTVPAQTDTPSTQS